MEIQLYRQYPDGVKLHKIDLTDRSIINSPLFYIQPNDLVYIVPLKSRTLGDMSNLQSSFGVVAPFRYIIISFQYIYFSKEFIKYSDE